MRRLLVSLLAMGPLVACSDEESPSTPQPGDTQNSDTQGSDSSGDSNGDTGGHSDTSSDGSDGGGTDGPAHGDPFTLVAGVAHICVYAEGGEARCWGRNSHYQLGNGSNANSTEILDSVVGPVFGLGLGHLHSCALQEGKVVCWGGNEDRQLGANTSLESSPTALTTTSYPALAIAAGGNHTCLLNNEGLASCWGSNGYGQLGDGERLARSVPVAVAPPRNQDLHVTFKSLGLGANHSCAISTEDLLYCWGSSESDQIDVTAGGVNIYPVQVSLPEGSTPKQVVGGFAHTCVLDTQGRVLCWGDDSKGQLGGAAPKQALDVPPMVHISAGYYHTCGVTEAQALYCWGDNSKGQNGHADTDNTAITQVSLQKVTQVAAGQSFTCAVHDGQVSCWGINASGQLLQSTEDVESTPIPQPIPL